MNYEVTESGVYLVIKNAKSLTIQLLPRKQNAPATWRTAPGESTHIRVKGYFMDELGNLWVDAGLAKITTEGREYAKSNKHYTNSFGPDELKWLKYHNSTWLTDEFIEPHYLPASSVRVEGGVMESAWSSTMLVERIRELEVQNA